MSECLMENPSCSFAEVCLCLRCPNNLVDGQVCECVWMHLPCGDEGPPSWERVTNSSECEGYEGESDE